jgi:hypothetical protein
MGDLGSTRSPLRRQRFWNHDWPLGGCEGSLWVIRILWIDPYERARMPLPSPT